MKPEPLNWPLEKMTFYSGSADLGTTTVVNGTTTFSTTKLEPGTHTITAQVFLRLLRLSAGFGFADRDCELKVSVFPLS